MNSKQTRPAFFRVEKRDGVWWLVTPNGERFFSTGVDVVDKGAERKNYNPKRPEYASFLFYPDDPAWANSVLTRLKDWGFNTIGAWGDVDALRGSSQEVMPYTVGLWMGSHAGVPWHDLFGPDTARIFEREAKRICEPRKDDTNLIGYFTDNELGWWDETIFLYQLKRPPNHTRRVLVDLLKRHYHGRFDLLQNDFASPTATSFAELERKGELRLRPGRRGREVIDEFMLVFARKYYQLAHDAIRKYDKNHLILGDRFIAWYPLTVAKVMGPYVDVVSSNYNADWTDGGNARYHFDSLHRITGKPILITEYYFCADQNRSGNLNPGHGFITVKTQKQRAAGFKKNLLSYARLPYVVGAHWFQYYDEPTFGRKDGENYNMGLVDIHDRPYEEITKAATEGHQEALELHNRSARAQVSAGPVQNIPHANRNPLDGLHGWDKDRCFVASQGNYPSADLYACWSRDRLHLAVYTTDYVDPNLYANGKLSAVDRPEWIIRIGNVAAQIRVLFGNGGKVNVDRPGVNVKQWVFRTRASAMISVPESFLSRKLLRSGDSIAFTSTATCHARTRKTTWSATLKLVP